MKIWYYNKPSMGKISTGIGTTLALLVGIISSDVCADTNLMDQSTITAPMPSPKSLAEASNITYPAEEKPGADRIQYRVSKAERGTTLKIPETDIIRLCADRDGCSVRLGMYDWDNSGRVASRESLFYYNHTNHAWRASAGDTAGTDYNGPTEHVMSAWACYLTDGAYKDWVDLGDSALNFGLLSWNQYVAECWLTIID